jgi:hypothetical protein
VPIKYREDKLLVNIYLIHDKLLVKIYLVKQVDCDKRLVRSLGLRIASLVGTTMG